MKNTRLLDRLPALRLTTAMAAASAVFLSGADPARADHEGAISQFVNQFGAGDGLWSNPANWNNHGPPDSTPTPPNFAFINITEAHQFGAPALVNSPASVVDAYVGQGAGDGALRVTIGGSLAVSGSLNLARDDGRSGTFTMDGGSLTAPNFFVGHQGAFGFVEITGGTATVGNLRLGNADANSTASAHVTITGGNFTVNGLTSIGTAGTTGRGSLTIGGDANFSFGATSSIAMRAGAGNSFNVEGSGATITGNRPSTTGFEVNQGNDVRFTFDAGGISTVNLGSSEMRFQHADTFLTVDATGYAAPGEFQLFTFARYFEVAGVPKQFGSENLMFAQGFTGSLRYDSNAITLMIIPEPGALTLLGAAGGALLIRRRRKSC